MSVPKTREQEKNSLPDKVKTLLSVKLNTVERLHRLNTSIFCLFNTTKMTICIIYEVHTISLQTFFVWALLLIVHT